MANLKDLSSLRGAFTWTMLMVFVIVNVSVFSYGFDNSVYSSIQAMTRKYSTSLSFLSVVNVHGIMNE